MPKPVMPGIPLTGLAASIPEVKTDPAKERAWQAGQFLERVLDAAQMFHADLGKPPCELWVNVRGRDDLILAMEKRMLVTKGTVADGGLKTFQISGMDVLVDAGLPTGQFTLKSDAMMRVVKFDGKTDTGHRAEAQCPKCGMRLVLEPVLPNVMPPPMPPTEDELLRDRLRLKLKASYATHAEVIREFCDGLRREGINLVAPELIDAAIQAFLERVGGER